MLQKFNRYSRDLLTVDEKTDRKIPQGRLQVGMIIKMPYKNDEDPGHSNGSIRDFVITDIYRNIILCAGTRSNIKTSYNLGDLVVAGYVPSYPYGEEDING